MERLLNSRIFKRIGIITIANYFSKAMGLLFFVVLIWLGGKELISRFYPVYLIHVFIVTINFYGFGLLILKKRNLNDGFRTNSLKEAYGLFTGLFLSLILLWLVIIKPDIELLLAIVLMIPALWIYEKINILRCNLFILNTDWEVVISQMIDSTLRVIISLVLLIFLKKSLPILILLSGATILSGVASLLYLSKHSVADKKDINVNQKIVLNYKNWKETFSALAIGGGVLLVPVLGWADDFLYRLLFDAEVVKQTIGTLSLLYTLMNSFIVIIISVFIVASTEKKFKIPLKKLVTLSSSLSVMSYMIWRGFKLPEYQYAGIILLIPFVVFIITKIYQKLDREDDYTVLLGLILLLITKSLMFWLLNLFSNTAYVNLSLLSSLAGLILMVLYLMRTKLVH